MAIVVVCQCGKKFHTKDENVGRKAKCPVCGNTLVIDRRAQGEALDASKEKAEAPSASTPRRVTPQAGRPSKQIDQVPHEASPAGPRGDTVTDDHVSPNDLREDSPLSVDQLQVLRQTERFRRRIRSAATCFRILFWAMLLQPISPLPWFVGSGIARNLGVVEFFAIWILLSFALAALFHWVYGATRDNRRWAPLTILVLDTNGMKITDGISA
jgi:DNA-directed RNA polymerase subunit RPC12/RpoP